MPLLGPLYCGSRHSKPCPFFLSTLHGAVSKSTGSCPGRVGCGYWTQQKTVIARQCQVREHAKLINKKVESNILMLI
jgi:hypothetical protein